MPIAATAAASGLAPSDVITAIDDAPIASMAAVVVRLRGSQPGDTIQLTVLRGTDKRVVKVTLADKPA